MTPEQLRSVNESVARHGALPIWYRCGLATVHREIDLFSRLKSEKPNSEGITFREWFYAARPGDAAQYYENGMIHQGKMADLRTKFPRELSAWLKGEDPTEWRAA